MMKIKIILLTLAGALLFSPSVFAETLGADLFKAK